jgi:hypothetical protein
MSGEPPLRGVVTHGEFGVLCERKITGGPMLVEASLLAHLDPR